MKELLEKWARLEPERCSKHWHGRHLVTISGPNEPGYQHPVDGDPATRFSYALIQAAVQEAIEARGWHWSLNTALMWGAGGFSGPLVYVAEIAYQFGNADDSYGDGDTAAEALLDAYLTALEAQG